MHLQLESLGLVAVAASHEEVERAELKGSTALEGIARWAAYRGFGFVLLDEGHTAEIAAVGFEARAQPVLALAVGQFVDGQTQVSHGDAGQWRTHRDIRQRLAIVRALAHLPANRVWDDWRSGSLSGVNLELDFIVRSFERGKVPIDWRPECIEPSLSLGLGQE